MENNVNDDYPNGIYPPAAPLRIPDTQDNECDLLASCRVLDPATNETKMVREVLVKRNVVVDGDSDSSNHRAYWLQRTLRQAQLGAVRKAVVLERTTDRPDDDDTECEWVVTDQRCAVKQMSWERIRNGRTVDDPIREINAMEFMSRALIPNVNDRFDTDVVRNTMDRTGVLLPLDVPLKTEAFLFVVMPYCDGGDLFDRVGNLSENQARHWFKQILTGIDTLQYLGLCHRDISLENILVHGTRCYIMDYGMTCRVPYTNVGDNEEWVSPQLRGERQMITPSGTMGSFRYMDPVIFENVSPFDGHAVDLHTVAAVLFMMVTGGPGWEQPQPTVGGNPDRTPDRAYLVITSGRLGELLRHWEIELSQDCVDLLQQMLLFPAQRRLSLAQICDHAWMQGPAESP